MFFFLNYLEIIFHKIAIITMAVLMVSVTSLVHIQLATEHLQVILLKIPVKFQFQFSRKGSWGRKTLKNSYFCRMLLHSNTNGSS